MRLFDRHIVVKVARSMIPINVGDEIGCEAGLFGHHDDDNDDKEPDEEPPEGP